MIPTPHGIDEATAYNNLDKQTAIELGDKILSITPSEYLEEVAGNINKIFDMYFPCRCCRVGVPCRDLIIKN